MGGLYMIRGAGQCILKWIKARRLDRVYMRLLGK